MDEPIEPAQPAEEGSRTAANLVLFSAFIVIVAVGAWLIFALDGARKADNCLAQGRRNCAPIQVPAR
jgi:hypothetical protein